jgi:uncharacterized protein (TIGR02145 family)
MVMRKYILPFIGFIFICFLASCDQKCQGVVCLNGSECVNGNCLFPPVVTTNTSVTNITLTTATSGGAVVSNGGSIPAQRGVCWSTHQNPTIDDNKTSDGNNIGGFTSQLAGLQSNSTYYIRAYATNDLQTAYGNEVSFSTISPAAFPIVTTSAVTNITSVSADGFGTVTDEGGSGVIERGICWSTSPNPTLSDNHSSSGSGLGSFTSSITGLSPAVAYYVRAYATNVNGTSYGNQVTFNSADGISGTISDLDGNFYGVLYIGTQVWMASNLKVTKYSNGDPISAGLSNSAWIATNTGAYSIYNDDLSNNSTYGKLYNWFAVNDSRNICPTGWHIPTLGEWNTLIGHLGSNSTAGGQLKSTGTTLWMTPNTGATNSSNFSARPGGIRSDVAGNYSLLGLQSDFWTATQGGTSTTGVYFKLVYNNASISNLDLDKNAGLSCRCIQD